MLDALDDSPWEDTDGSGYDVDLDEFDDDELYEHTWDEDDEEL